MATSKIKKGDTVKVIVGKDKGREGKVTAVKDGKVIIEGINQVMKHTKPRQANPQALTHGFLPMSQYSVQLMRHCQNISFG